MTTLTIMDADERTVVLSALRLYVARAREVHRPDKAQCAARLIARLVLGRMARS